MKEIIYIGTHKHYNALRLGLCLAHTLQKDNQTVILAGRQGKLPCCSGLKTCEFPSTAKCGTLATAFKKEKVRRVISVVSLTACEAALKAKVPYIYIEPENFKEETPAKNKKTLLKNALQVIVVGTSDKALDRKHYGPNAVRVKNPAMAVKHDTTYKPLCFKQKNNIVAAGKLCKDGGMDVLLRVWAQMAPMHPSWHLTVWGEGGSKPSYKRFVAEHQLEHNTEIVGMETDLADLLRGADIYVHPSPCGDGLDCVLDALASRLPVIAANVPAARAYITNDVNGYVVPAKDKKAWANALDSLVSNWGKRVQLALEAEKTKERFSLKKFVSLFEE